MVQWLACCTFNLKVSGSGGEVVSLLHFETEGKWVPVVKWLACCTLGEGEGEGEGGGGEGGGGGGRGGGGGSGTPSCFIVNTPGHPVMD